MSARKLGAGKSRVNRARTALSGATAAANARGVDFERELDSAQRDVLRLLAAGAPLAESLAALLRAVERLADGMIGSILLLDADGLHVRHGAAPSLPAEFVRAIDGEPIGPRAGSCGTAAWRGEAVIVEDIATDPLWSDYREGALAIGLRACWSTPIFDPERRVLGTFAIYYREPRLPDARHSAIITLVTDLAAIAITRERAGQALLESEERLRLALDAAHMGTFDWDILNDRIVWSRWHEELWGFAPGEFGGTYQAFSARVHPEDLPGIDAEVARCIAAREPFVREFRIVWPDGSVHWIAARGEFQFGDDDRPHRMRGAVTETTVRKLAEAERDRLFTLSPDLLCIAGFDGRLRQLNPAWERALGWSIAELLARPWLDFVHPGDREATERASTALARGESVLDFENRYRRRDGSYRWLSWSAYPLAEAGQIFAVARDVTEHKLAEERDREGYRRLRDLIDGLGPALFVGLLTPDGRVVEANRPALRAAGLEPEDVLGRPVEETYWWSYSQEVQRQLRAAVERAARGEGSRYDVEVRASEDQFIFLDFSIEPLRDENGDVTFLVPSASVITERKSAERALRSSEEKFSSAFHLGPAAMTITRIADGTFVDANDAFCELFEFDRREVIGHTSTELELWTPEARQKLVEEQLRTGGLRNHELEARARSGRLVSVLFSSKEIQIDGQACHLTTLIDITQRKAVETALVESEARYRGLFTSMNEAVVIADLIFDAAGRPRDFRFLEVNPAYTAQTGVPANEVLGRTALECFPRVEAWWLETCHQAVLTGAPAYCENYNEDTDRYFDLRVFSLGGARFAGIFSDVTERRRAAAAIARVNERLALATRAAHVGIWDWDVAGDRLVWDDAMFELYGIRREDFAGAYEAWASGLHPDDRERCDEETRRALSGTGEYETEFRVVWPDGTVRTLQALGTVFFNEEGQPLRMLGVNFDITDRKRAVDGLRRLTEELERRVAERTAELAARNRELETFTYSVSHDLKAPLRGLDGYSRLLLEEHAERLDDEGRQFLHTIRRAAQQMSRLIDDLLAYSRLERRSMSAGLVSLEPLVGSLVAERADEIAGRKIAVHVEVPELTVSADADGLALAIRNLLDNALKFTRDAREPRLEIRVSESSERIVLSVGDNGVGFDMRFHDRIFDIFQRLHARDEFDGTGIGLAIVHKAMERMGGRAWAESEPGRGATFFLEMPR